mgnify:CR=1 FL=1
MNSCVLFQAEDVIRDLVRSRGLGDVYKRQEYHIHVYRKVLILVNNCMLNSNQDLEKMLYSSLNLSLIHI